MGGSSSDTPLGAVLAGGLGRRLGGGKAAAPLGGRPLISYPLAAFAAAGIEAVVCAKPGEELPAVTAPVLREPAEPRHPLCGIVAALRAGEGRAVIALACDLPFVTPGLLATLAAAPEPLVVPRLGGRPQPLLARYEPSLLSRLETALGAEQPLIATIEALGPRYLEGVELRRHGDPARLLFNVNDDGDLRRAQEMQG